MNPFGKNGSDGQREWNNSKNSFLNNLYKTLSYTEETKKESFPDKESIHYNLNNQGVEAHKEDTAYSLSIDTKLRLQESVNLHLSESVLSLMNLA